MLTTKLNKTTQKAKCWADLYNISNCDSVQLFYGRCSYAKIRIENDIQERMKKMNCFDYRVISGNTFCFTCGYRSKDNKKLYIETSCNIFEIDL